MTDAIDKILDADIQHLRVQLLEAEKRQRALVEQVNHQGFQANDIKARLQYAEGLKKRMGSSAVMGAQPLSGVDNTPKPRDFDIGDGGEPVENDGDSAVGEQTAAA